MDRRRWASVEATTGLNFGNLVRKVKKNLLERHPDIKTDALNDKIYQSLKTFKINDQVFDYSSSPNYLGGVKWYVLCPRCNKPVLRLYLPNKHKDRDQLYLCKDCHKLKHASLLLGNTKRYKKVVKPLRQLERLRMQLLKKNMTPEKAKPLLEEYEKIESELASSTEYRLYRFQKEHGMQG